MLSLTTNLSILYPVKLTSTLTRPFPLQPVHKDTQTRPRFVHEQTFVLHGFLLAIQHLQRTIFCKSAGATSASFAIGIQDFLWRVLPSSRHLFFQNDDKKLNASSNTLSLFLDCSRCPLHCDTC